MSELKQGEKHDRLISAGKDLTLPLHAQQRPYSQPGAPVKKVTS